MVRFPILISILSPVKVTVTLEVTVTLFSNFSQMCIFKRIFMFQAITEDAVEARVPEQDCPCEHQRGQRKQVTHHIKRHCNSLVVDEVIGPRADSWSRQISKHTQV